MRLQKHKFRKWLEGKKPEEIVGHNRDCHSCPIALFYADVTGGCEIVIFSDPDWGGYIIDRGYIRTKPPTWADNFMFEVDGKASGGITAGLALETLSRC